MMSKPGPSIEPCQCPDSAAGRALRPGCEPRRWLPARKRSCRALIAHLELRIEKLKRELYGQRSERTARLIEQLELELEELATTASEDELAARAAASKTQSVRAFTQGLVFGSVCPCCEEALHVRMRDLATGLCIWKVFDHVRSSCWIFRQVTHLYCHSHELACRRVAPMGLSRA
jgi:hypothetical protein